MKLVYIIIQLFVFSFLHINFVCSLDDYKLKLKPNSRRCFNDDVFKNTFIRLEIICSSINIDVHFKAPGKETIIYKNSKDFKQIFTSDENGDIEFCIYSNDNEDVYVDLIYYTGLEAKDFGGLIKENDLKPFNIKLENLEKSIKSIKVKYTNAQYYLGMYDTLSDKISGYIGFWFIVVIFVVSGIGLLELAVIKKKISTYKLK